MEYNNHVGEKHGSYTIIEELNERANDGHRYYMAECVCGEKKKEIYSSIIKMKTSKCPHYATYGKIRIRNNMFSIYRLSSIFRQMLIRCYCEDSEDYRYYGGKGIKVCQEWINNPISFEEWALQNGYADDLTIDRIKENQDYSPSNCRWVTRENNARFKSTTNYITATVTLSGKQWASLIPEIGANRINKIFREKGEDAAISFIEERLQDKRAL